MVEIDRQRLEMIGASALPLLLGAGLAFMVLDSSVIGDVLARNSLPFSLYDILLQVVISSGLGTLVVLALYWTIQRRGAGTKRAIVAFIVSPLLTASFFLVGQSLLLIVFKGTTPSIVPSLLSLASLSVLLMSFAFIMMDSVPSGMKNFFVAFYGSVFGTFLGIIFITASMFVLVITVVFEDYFLTRYSPSAEAVMDPTAGADPFDFTRIESERTVVGVGDYIAFSLISAHSLIFFPLYVWAASLILAFIGIVINVMVLARKDEILSGIPLPALLALFPWVVHLLSLSMLA
ncbi:MAG: hypothetical protein ACP6KW_03165 [Candidatus Thorarchaeota archaeon]